MSADLTEQLLTLGQSVVCHQVTQLDSASHTLPVSGVSTDLTEQPALQKHSAQLNEGTDVKYHQNTTVSYAWC